MGRTFTYRKLTALGWSTALDGSIAGIIKVEIFKDQQHTQPAGEPVFYFGSVAEPNMEEKGAYYDARQITETGTKITPKMVEELSEAMIEPKPWYTKK